MRNTAPDSLQRRRQPALDESDPNDHLFRKTLENLMKAQFRNPPFALFFTVAAALLAEVAAQATPINTAIMLTAPATSICEVGSCDAASLQAGALNNIGNASSIPS